MRKGSDENIFNIYRSNEEKLLHKEIKIQKAFSKNKTTCLFSFMGFRYELDKEEKSKA